MNKAIDKHKIERLQELHGLVVSSAVKTFEAAIEAGKILTEIKQDLPHGSFTSWCEENLPFNIRTAQRYMRCYASRDKLLKNDSVSLLSGAYRMLEKPKEKGKPVKRFDFIEFIDQQFREKTNGKMGIKDRLGLEILAPMTESEWNESFEIIKQLPVNENRPISTLEGLAPFLIGDWFLYASKIEKAIEAMNELTKLAPEIAEYITDRQSGNINKDKLHEMMRLLQTELNNKG